jgi:hypothetical protein
MGWAELNALRDLPPSDLIGGFQNNRDIARAMGYPSEVIARFDSILDRLRRGASTRSCYEDIRDLRIWMQEMSATLYSCERTGGGPKPSPQSCDQPLSCGFCLGSGIRSKWLSLGGEGGILGCPTMDEADAIRSPQGTTGRYAEFRGGDGGYIFWHGAGGKRGLAFEVDGCFFKLYKGSGNAGSWLGFPTSDGYQVQGGARQDFEGGFLTWDARSRECQSHRGGDVRTALDGLRWEIPCGGGGGEHYCDCSDPAPRSTVLAGPDGMSYDVTLRFRGVVELKTYDGGWSDGLWQVGGSPANDPYNVYRLEISSPPQVYYLNRGTSGLETCQALDYTRTVRMAVGATVTLSAQALDGYQIKNRDGARNPIVVPGVPPAPAAYAGQFIEMDVVEVRELR